MSTRAAAKAIVQLKARMREPLRARLEAAAKRRGVSLNAELVDRVERSFAKDDAFGGLVIANMARLMAAAFLQGGQRTAHESNHPNWRPAQWVHNADCYDAAVKAVVRVLRSLRPWNLPPPGPVTLDDLREHYGLIEPDVEMLVQDASPLRNSSTSDEHPRSQQPKRAPKDER